MLEYDYNYGLVALSLVMAVVTSHIALATAARIRVHAETRVLWIVGGALSMGLGIWVMHFIGMTAYHLPIDVAYDVPMTVVSMLLAVVSSAFTFYVVTRTDQLTLPTNLMGAVLLGSGVAGMHYTGIFAMKMQPAIVFTPALFTLSLVIAFTASFFALRFVFASSMMSNCFFGKRNFLASVIMGVAIAGMHYTALEAQFIAPDAVCGALQDGIRINEIMTLSVVVVVFILLITAIILAYDLRLARSSADGALFLADANKRMMRNARDLADEMSENYRESEAFSRRLFDTVGNVIVVLDSDGRIVRFNNAAEHSTGFSADEVIGGLIWDWVIPPEMIDSVKAVFADLKAGHFPSTHKNEWLTKSGERRLFAWNNTAITDDDGAVDFVVGTGSDITERQQDKDALRLSAVAFETSEAIVITDAYACILRVNKAFSQITGYEPEEVVGKKTSVLRSGRHDEDFYQAMWKVLSRTGNWKGEIWNKRKNGEIYPEWLSITAVCDDDGTVKNYVASFSDISEIKEADEKLSFYANFDPLTSLPNRKLFIEQLHQTMTLYKRKNQRGALLYLELSDLDILQETVSIEAADDYLTQLGGFLTDLFEGKLVVGHIGRGGFAAFTSGYDSNEQMISVSHDVIDRIFSFAASGIDVCGTTIFPKLNIGVSVFPKENIRADGHLQRAMAAAHTARSDGANTSRFFSEDMQTAASELFGLEAELRRAIERDELRLFYQPQHDDTGAIIGAEALVRWERNGELISPARFIPLAEASNLILDIGQWCLQEACWVLKILEARGLPDSFVNIAVNVSPKQVVQDDFVKNLKETMIMTEIEPQRLKLEVTESLFFSRPDAAFDTLKKIRDLDVKIAMDDFGTGYSSLSYLHKMPLDQLKIDQSFVHDLTINKHSQAIAETIIRMAQTLDLAVIAEGVETLKERKLLESYGCRHFQGFLFSKALTRDDFFVYLDRYSS